MLPVNQSDDVKVFRDKHVAGLKVGVSDHMAFERAFVLRDHMRADLQVFVQRFDMLRRGLFLILVYFSTKSLEWVQWASKFP